MAPNALFLRSSLLFFVSVLCFLPEMATFCSSDVGQPGLLEPMFYVHADAANFLGAGPSPTIKTEVRPRSSAAGQIPSVLRPLPYAPAHGARSVGC
jgi:hypothetical protein